MFGLQEAQLRGTEKLHIEKLCNLHFTSASIRVMGQVERVRRTYNSYKIEVEERNKKSN
jgi:hypothetical protein